MPQIHVENLMKSFRIAQRSPGVWGALTGLVNRQYRTVNALDGISFSMEKGEMLRNQWGRPSHLHIYRIPKVCY